MRRGRDIGDSFRRSGVRDRHPLVDGEATLRVFVPEWERLNFWLPAQIGPYSHRAFAVRRGEILTREIPMSTKMWTMCGRNFYVARRSRENRACASANDRVMRGPCATTLANRDVSGG